VDEVSLKSHPAPDLQGEALLDDWLKAWFQQRLAEPVPQRFLDLIERLDTAAGL